MKKIILVALIAGASLTSLAPVQAMTLSAGLFDMILPQDSFDRRKPRVPGGSGCDDPRDLIEHPECAPA